MAGTKLVPYYFHGDGSLSPTKAAGVSAKTTYTFDPRYPVPTIGGGASARLKDGAFNQREDPRFLPSHAPWLPLRSRADVVVFQTEPLKESGRSGASSPIRRAHPSIRHSACSSWSR
ncbi:hypothetical protein [Gemmatimonas sp.]|uniref:hypothetical protein n=1 Tax=Gemmatimonas sp. TaxID=1962908 RepID=UPI0035697924